LEIQTGDEENLQKEIEILKEAGQSPYVVNYFGCYMKDSTLLIVMEYCDGGSCIDIIRDCSRPLKEGEISAILACTVQGLIFLHGRNILHRDLKAANVLLTSGGVAKLADFGVSAKLQNTMQKKKTVVGSPYWIAPEMITKAKADGYGHQADIWSLGITAYELAVGEPPLFDIPSMRVIFIIPKRDPPQLPNMDKWSTELNNFLATCLQKDPQGRPAAKELLEHPFIIRGQKNKHLIKALVEECLPKLEEVRAKKKTTEEEEGDAETGSFSSMSEWSNVPACGTDVRINTHTGLVSFSSSDGSNL